MNVLNNCKRKLASITFIASLLPWAGVHGTTEIDMIAAVINNDVIMQSELITEITDVRDQLQRQNAAIPAAGLLQGEVLDQLILELLQLQEAERLGIEVSDTMLNNAMANIAQNNKLTLPQLHKAIVANGNSVASFRSDIQRKMTIDEVSKIAIKRRIKVSEKEIDLFLDSQQGQELADTEYLLSHIMIAIPTQATQQQVDDTEAKLQQLQAEIAEEVDFASLASKYSSANNAASGGSLGWRKASQLPALFAKAIANMKVGEISQPVRNSSGYHLIKIIEQRGLAVQQVQQTKANHILILSNDIRSAADTKILVDDIYQRLQTGTDFYKLARSFSDDANTALNGGDMGWLNPGQVPNFMQTQLDTLGDNEISAPFKGPSGWHILQVSERQTKDVGYNMLRNKARTALYDSKFAGEMETWLRELRNQAYIEIR